MRGIGGLDRRAQRRSQRFIFRPHLAGVVLLCTQEISDALSSRGSCRHVWNAVQTDAGDDSVRAFVDRLLDRFRKEKIIWLLLEKIPFALVAAGSAVATVLAQHGQIDTFGFSLPLRFENAIVSYAIYLRQLIWPVDLAVLYPHPEKFFPFLTVAGCAALLISLSAIAFIYRKRFPFLFTGWFWFVGMLVPVIGVVQVGRQAHADRYTYLPLIGITIAIVWLVAELTVRWRFRKQIGALVSAVVIIALSACAYHQTTFWRNADSLWPHTLAVTTNNDGAHLAFATSLFAEGKTEEQALPPDQPHQTVASFSMPAQLGKVAGTEQRQPVPAAPHVRRLSREVGIDIYEVKGTGPGGRISEDDVKAHAKALLSTAAAAAATPRAGHFAQPHLPDFAKWGKIERVSMRGVRRKTAQHLAEAWNTIPHVTQHDRADITELEHLRARFAPKAEEAGGKMTVTAIALKVCAAALKVFPQFNASIDIEKEEIVYKQYINIGVAADTDRGLLVPVIRDVEKKNIVELAVELSGLSKKARDKKLTPADMEGGTFTITNLGGIGGVGFTPIVNFPEVAILGLSRSRIEPEWINGKFEPRLILPLSLSYDHRLIDGADAARFLRWISEAFEQPFLLSVQG